MRTGTWRLRAPRRAIRTALWLLTSVRMTTRCDRATKLRRLEAAPFPAITPVCVASSCPRARATSSSSRALLSRPPMIPIRMLFLARPPALLGATQVEDARAVVSDRERPQGHHSRLDVRVQDRAGEQNEANHPRRRLGGQLRQHRPHRDLRRLLN